MCGQLNSGAADLGAHRHPPSPYPDGGGKGDDDLGKVLAALVRNCDPPNRCFSTGRSRPVWVAAPWAVSLSSFLKHMNIYGESVDRTYIFAAQTQVNLTISRTYLVDLTENGLAFWLLWNEFGCCIVVD